MRMIGSERLENAMKEVPLSNVKDDLSKYLRLAEKQAIVITRHGKPAGVIVGFASEDDWFDYRIVNDPRFRKHPMILETPKEHDEQDDMDRVNLRALRDLLR